LTGRPPSPSRPVPPSPFTGAPGFTLATFHEAMVSDAQYARPYLLMLDHLGVWTPLLFPLVGHFALQTEKPIPVLLRAAHELSRTSMPFPRGPIGPSQVSLIDVVEDACQRAAAALGLPPLVDGEQVMKTSSLSENPLFRHFRTLFAAAKSAFGPDSVKNALALPGWGRSLLGHLRPAVTNLSGGRWTAGSPLQIGMLDSAGTNLVVERFGPEALQVDGGFWHLTSDSREHILEGLADYAEKVADDDQKLRFTGLLERKKAAVSRAAAG
jgi:hypothetical protein